MGVAMGTAVARGRGRRLRGRRAMATEDRGSAATRIALPFLDTAEIKREKECVSVLDPDNKRMARSEAHSGFGNGTTISSVDDAF